MGQYDPCSLLSLLRRERERPQNSSLNLFNAPDFGITSTSTVNIAFVG